MKGKNLVIFGLGAAGGFIGGGVFVLGKVFESERLRQASVEILADKIGNVLFGEKSRYQKCNQRVSYKNYYTSKRAHRIDRCIFETRKDAQKVLEALYKCAADYGMVTIPDYYDLCDIPNHYIRFEDRNYGWLKNSIAKACVVHVYDGYTIELPRAIKLN